MISEATSGPKLYLKEPSSFKGLEAPSAHLEGGLAIFVGPNGSGKTQALRAVKQGLDVLVGPIGLKTRFLAAGRSSPLEHFRSAVNYPGSVTPDTLFLGSSTYLPSWHAYESVIGDFLALGQRGDLLLKVQARLQTFLSRSLQLSWSQSGLEIRLIGRDGVSYPANTEASGVLHLVPLLASIYHDEIGALLIDEPEISLHPQYQAFIRDELSAVAGDPRTEPGKKFVVIATHAPTMLSVRQAPDLSKIVFFQAADEPPRQLAPDAPELKNRKIAALVARLNATHRLAFFAENVLLLEGPSDELIVEQLAALLEMPLLAANTQLVPVNGKGEIAEAAKLFRLLGKRVAIIADLDGLVDDNKLVNLFGGHEDAAAAAQSAGHQSLQSLDRTLRAELSQIVINHWPAIEAVVGAHSYWEGVPPEKRDDGAKKRALLASLLSDHTPLHNLLPDVGFQSLQRRFSALIDLLALAGCVFLKRGAIEAYFVGTTDPNAKVETASAEAMGFASENLQQLELRYEEVVTALRYAAQRSRVDENTMLRARLGAVLGAAFQTLQRSTDDAAISTLAAEVLGSYASIFELQNVSTETDRRLRVTIKSLLFKRDRFPFEISANDNLTAILSQVLPPTL